MLIYKDVKLWDIIFLMGLHLVDYAEMKDASKALDKFYEFMRTTSDLRKHSDYIKKNIINQFVMVDKIRVFRVPQMTIEDISIESYVKSNINVIGFNCDKIVPVYGGDGSNISDAYKLKLKLYRKTISESVNKKDIGKDYKVAIVSMNGGDKVLGETNASILPLYYLNGLVSFCDTPNSKIMTFIDKTAPDAIETNRATIYVDIFSGSYLVTQYGNVISSTLDLNKYKNLIAGNSFGFYKLCFSSDSSIKSSIKYVILNYNNYKLSLSGQYKALVSNKYSLGINSRTPSVVVIPPNTEIINIVGDNSEYRKGITVILPPRFTSLRLQNADNIVGRVRFLLYKGDNPENIVKAMGIKPKLLETPAKAIQRQLGNVGVYDLR